MNCDFYDITGFQDRVRAKRKSMHLKQEQLSDKLGYAPSYISQIETGKRSPSISALIALASCLNVSIDYLLLGSERSAYDSLDVVTAKLSASERDALANAIQHLLSHDSADRK